jgi:hypothetical protein
MDFSEAKRSVCKMLSEYVTVSKSDEYDCYDWDFDSKKAKFDLTKMYGEDVAVVLIESFSDDDLTWELAHERQRDYDCNEYVEMED